MKDAQGWAGILAQGQNESAGEFLKTKEGEQEERQDQNNQHYHTVCYTTPDRRSQEARVTDSVASGVADFGDVLLAGWASKLAPVCLLRLEGSTKPSAGSNR